MKFTIKINSILGGQSPGLHIGKEDQFTGSVNIDPDYPDQTKGYRTAHVLTPSPYSDFSDTDLSAAPMWLLTNPRNNKLYVYLLDGTLLSYDSTLLAATEADYGKAVITSDGDGSGAAYYNNYFWLAVNNSALGGLSSYGPLTGGTPGWSQNRWAGWSLTALNDTTYPSGNADIEYPNHAMHRHIDNKLYFCDFKAGQGMIHFVKTKKTTIDGDTNDGSTYNALDLPFGYRPIDIESYGTDLAILAFYGSSDSTIVQGRAALFLWDTVSDSFYRQVPLLDAFASALLNNNGRLYIFSGNISSGIRVSEYLGGSRIKTVAFSEYGRTPFSSAVDAMGDRVVWGTNMLYPSATNYYSTVMSLGYKNIQSNAVHNIIATDAVPHTTGVGTTCLRFAQHQSFIGPRLVVGWKDNTNQGIDKLGATTNHAYWRSLFYTVGKPFKINKIILPLGFAVAANMTITPKLLVDDEASTETQTVINNTNYPNSEKRVVLYPTIQGLNNLALELKWTGTAQLSVQLPIIIEGETLEERTE